MTNAYDEIPYPSGAFPETHPDRIAALAALFGVDGAPVERADILEIGCGDGSNLIPIAQAYPQSRCVGIDLAAGPVRRGRAVVESLGLTNIDLRQEDLRTVDLGSDSFDYIIAQGVYSWVPDTARDGLLALVSQRLAPNGIAFVSYNALPGCRIRQALRDALFFAVKDVTSPRARLDGATERLRVLAQPREGADAFQALLAQEAGKLLSRSSAGWAHDELSDAYHPVLIHDFAAHCASRELAILTEAEPRETRAWLTPSALVDYPGFDPVASAQERDFVETRYFRQSLLVRAGAKIDRRPRPARLAPLHISSQARRDADGAFTAPNLSFKIPDHPLATVVEALGAAWPATSPVASLGLDPGRLDGLLHLHGLGAVELHATASNFPTRAGERPVASPLARLQASAGETRLTTLRHTMVDVDDEFSRNFIATLDGTRTRQEIARDVGPAFGHTAESAQAPIEVLLGVLAHAPLLVA